MIMTWIVEESLLDYCLFVVEIADVVIVVVEAGTTVSDELEAQVQILPLERTIFQRIQNQNWFNCKTHRSSHVIHAIYFR